MAYQVLARRWRPQRFDEVVGQPHVTRTLANAIRTGRLAHAFLFSGPRGVGKTTTARILAKCLNCERAADGPVVDPCNECAACREIGLGTSLDVLEIDGASNRGIDEIRELRENVRYAPSGGRAKVYIIDEVHMLTKEAFNALLKTLEEPPAGVYFVFATTEAHKVPATIRSRCQAYDFHRIPQEAIREALARLAEREGFDVEPAALAELARLADGGLRDAQSLLDQAAAVGEGSVTLEGLRDLLGEAAEESYLAIVRAVAAGRPAEAFAALQALLERGMDPGRVAERLTQMLRDLLVVQAAPDEAASLGVPEERVGRLAEIAGGLSGAKMTALLALASRTVSDLRRASRPRLVLEVALARMCRLEDPGEIAEIARRLEALEAARGGGRPPPAGRAGPPGPSSGGERAAENRPPERPEGPSPRASGAEATPPGRVGEVWTRLLERVRARKVMLASFLEHGEPSSLDEESLTAVFENDYYEGMVGRRENLAILGEELAGLLGRKLRFRVRTGGGPARQSSRPEAPAAQNAAPGRDLLDENPGLGRIVRDLGGQLLPGGGSFRGGEA